MKNKLFFHLVICLLLVIITGCDNKENKLPNTTTETSDIITITDEKELELNKVNLDEKVILDKNGIKITAKSIDYDVLYGPDIEVIIENNSSNNVVIQTRNFTVNDILIEPVFSVDVNKGKKVVDVISISRDELEKANISTLKDIVFDIVVLNSTNFESIFEEKDIRIQTKASEYNQVNNTEGVLILDQNDIKISVLGKSDKDKELGVDIYVYIENNSLKDITVQSDDVSINGYVTEPTFSIDVKAGKKIYSSITFLDTDLKKNNINEIKEIKLKFNVFESNTWKSLLTSDSKKIVLEKESDKR